MNITNVLGLEFANSSVAETAEYALQLMSSCEGHYVAAPDSEMVHEISDNKRLRASVRGASLLLPAGNGVLLAASILGTPIKNRISAFDFSSALMARMSEKQMSVYIFAPNYEILEAAQERIAYRFPGLKLYSGDEDYYSNELELIEVINDIKPDLLLVCMGTYRQEQWMYRHKDELQVGLMLGFGEELRIYAGISERAPKRWRDSGFEWLYWIIKEPKRLVRTLKRGWIVFAALWRRLFGY